MYIQNELPKCKITISTPIKRHDHGEASLTISHLSKKFNLVYELLTAPILELLFK